MAIDNLKIAESIKKLQESILVILDSQTKSQRTQLEVSKQLAESIASVSTNSQGATDQLGRTQESLQKAAEAAEKLGSSKSMNMFEGSLKKSTSQSGKLNAALRSAAKTAPQFGVMVGIFEGFAEGINASVSAFRLFSSVGMGALDVVSQLAVGIISFPFRLLSGLIDFASKGGGDSGLRAQLEEIRKEFGSLKKTSGNAIVTIARSMKGELANTGLSVWRVFGNLAERLKAVAEYAKNLGPLFGVLSAQFVKNGEALGAYFKGLGLTEEGQRAVASRAHALGQDVTEVTRQMTNFSVQLGDQFGLSAKEISRDMGVMMADFEHFGGMAPQVLAQVSVYARRLGVDIKGLLGVVEQFDNFEGAATSAAQLTQAFGLQIDALEMLKEQDPAARTERLRKAFFAAGRSIEGMTRQERALLTQQTGLEASSLDLIFSQKNQALSYDQVKKKSEGARKSQLTQEEALSKLSDAIERMVKSGSGPSGGFFERFFQGFERGIVMSRDFRQIMINIRLALRQTYRAGVEVGRMFVNLFPGIQQVFKGLAGLFDRAKFTKMTGSLKTIFESFFKSLTGSNSKSSFHNLMENLKEMFWNYFDSATPEGKGILDGVKNFSKAASVILAGMITEIANGLTKGITFITDLLSGRTKLGGGGAASGALGFVGELLEPIVGALKAAWPPIVEALSRLWDEEVWPRVSQFLRDNAGRITMVLFGPALLRTISTGLAAAFSGALSTAVTEGVKGMFSSAAKGAVEAGAKALVGQGTAAATAAAAETAAATAGLGTASKAASAAANLTSMLKTAAIITGGVLLIIAAIAGLAEYMRWRKLTPTQMLTSAAVVATAGLVMIELAGALAIVSQAGNLIQASMSGVLAGLAAVGVVGLAMVAGIALLVDTLKEYQPSQVNNALKAMVAGSAFILAATGVVIGAMGIGALLIGTGGTGILALGVGLATIGTVVELMVVEIENIIDKVGALRIPSNFDRNFQIFTMTLESVGTFGALIAQISESSSNSSLAGWFTGSGADDQIRTLESLKGFMSEMSTVLLGIVQDVLRQVSALSAAPAQFQKAELFSRIMSSLSDAAQNLMPPESFMQTSGILGGIFGANVSARLKSLGEFIEVVTTSLQGTLTTVVAQFAKIASGVSITEGTKYAFDVVGNILTTLATLARNMMQIVNTQYSGLTEAELKSRLPVITGVISGMMNTIFGQGSSGLITSIGAIIRVMTTALSGLSERDATRLKTLGPVLTAAFEAIATIGATTAQLGTLIEGMPAEARGSALGTINSIVGTMLYGIRDVISSIVTSTKGLFTGLSKGDAANLNTGVTSFKGMLEAISTLPQTISGLWDMVSKGGTETEYEPLRQRFGSIISLFHDDGSSPGFPTLLREISAAFDSVPMVEDPSGRIGRLAKNFEAVSTITNLVKGVSENIDLIRSASITGIGNDLKAMVDEVNAISHKLGTVDTVNLKTNLKSLANNLGLGSNEELTITNRNFNIKVKLEVKIDAAELERVLVGRPDTTIQHS